MQIIKVSPYQLETLVKKLAEEIKKGKILICPTDTIYGLLGDATNDKVVKKIFIIKKRSKSRPLPVFVKDVEMAKSIAVIEKKWEEVLKKIWPGKVTVVFKKKKNIDLSPLVSGETDTVGLRMPDFELINKILKFLNKPLTATSANLSGGNGAYKIKSIINQFRGQEVQPDILVDAGNLESKTPSTVIDLSEGKVKIIREGALSKKDLFNKICQKR